MPFELNHVLVSADFLPERHDGPDGTSFTLSASGTFKVLHPGRFKRAVSATARYYTKVNGTSVPQLPSGPVNIDGMPTTGTATVPGNKPPRGPLKNFFIATQGLAFDFQVLDPNGNPFTSDTVTLADIRRFRDRRGISRDWSYRFSVHSQTFFLSEATNDSLYDEQASVKLEILETIPSVSAPPLFPPAMLVSNEVIETFDLYRLGVLSVTVDDMGPFAHWQGHIRLLDPDGALVAESSTAGLHWVIPPAALSKSRDAEGKPRLWTLRVNTTSGGHTLARVRASVIAEGRIHKQALQERFDKILGTDGRILQVFGRNSSGYAEVVMKVTDVVAAETLDMFGVFDHLLRSQGDLYPDYNVNDEVVLYRARAAYEIDELGTSVDFDVSDIRIDQILLDIGPARHLSAETPALRLTIMTSGRARVKWHGHELASVAPSGGRLEVDVGLKIDPDGTPRIVQAINDDAIDLDVNDGVIVLIVAALTALFGLPVAALSTYEAHEIVEDAIAGKIISGVADLFSSETLAPSIFMKLFGAHFTYRPVQFDGDDILFPHFAMNEIEPAHRKNYAGAIGRMVMDEAVGHVTFHPFTLGDTWKADNLKNKVEQIVLVMMENRSYDHVLGARALGPAGDGTGGDGANGLSKALIDGVRAAPIPHSIAPLKDATFAKPGSPFPFTRIPVGVGHGLADVRQQMEKITQVAGLGPINDPQGFVDNFLEHKLHNQAGGYYPLEPTNPPSPYVVMPDDVLGYYGRGDLPMFDFLADNFTYCDRYFSSHPGPTMPNRMYWLIGEPQYDRYGEPILDNNSGDNFLLSAQPTIFDILSREGVGWRVYESSPSIATLRMFSRYASDVSNIRPLDEFLADAEAGRLPPVTMVEPAMHHHPEDDDHPDADMIRGQLFIQKVYNALRAKPEKWRNTLLIITYDEHGGLYDHVVPPIADVFNNEPPSVVSDGGQPSSTSGGSDGGPSTGGNGWGHGSNFGDRLPQEVVEVLAEWVSDGEPAPDPNTPVKVPYGVRVPTFVISPWVAPGANGSKVLDHCSIMKTILARFCSEKKPFLSDRIHVSHSFDSLLTESSPRDVGAFTQTITQPSSDQRREVSPNSMIDTAPLYRARMMREQVDYHEVSGRLARVLGR